MVAGVAALALVPLAGATADQVAAADAAALITGAMEKFEIHQTPQDLPDLTFTDEAGNELTLADFKGRTVLLNLWATWCAPCIHEMPYLDDLQAKAGSSEFHVLALSLDRSPVLVQQFYERTNLQALPVYMDLDGAAIRTFSPKGLPTTMLIGPGGKEIGRLTGDAVWNAPEAIALIGHFVRAARQQPES